MTTELSRHANPTSKPRAGRSDACRTATWSARKRCYNNAELRAATRVSAARKHGEFRGATGRSTTTTAAAGVWRYALDRSTSKHMTDTEPSIQRRKGTNLPLRKHRVNGPRQHRPRPRTHGTKPNNRRRAVTTQAHMGLCLEDMPKDSRCDT